MTHPHCAGRRRQGGSQLLVLVVLLLALGALGAWNYHRNWTAEQAEQGARPFAGYAERDLEQLAEAYRQEIEAHRRSYERARGAQPEARDTDFVGDGVREFERVQRHAQRTRALGAELAEREARVREIEKELAYRARLRGGWSVHLQRLLAL